MAWLSNGETYPAATADGGREWKIDGPVFHIPAANGPAVVTLVGAAAPRTYFAFGGGSVVDLTTDGGVHWWAAFLGEDVLAIVPGTKAHHLIAVVQDSAGSRSSKLMTVVYLSKDGGRHWRRNPGFAY